LRPLYTATGRGLFAEGEIAELSGYAGSRPVRIGNAAAQQVQLDVFGPIANLVWTLALHGAPLSAEHVRLVEALVSAVRQRWHEPDHGIWEPRRPPRHNVHSKVMCWVTVDRATKLAQDLWDGPRAEWLELADRIKADVLEHGWKPSRNAFTAAYDGEDLDAGVLQIGLSGLLAPDDPRFVATVEAIERELRDGPTVYRYRSEDGLPGPEGGFHLLAAWLVDAYLAIGRRDDARALFRELVGLAGPTGLYSEQVDPATRRALGNHPQAYSHLALIHSALNLAQAVAGVAER
jgi:GH15 family glucan-1,4-alpha-glucosidase